MNNTQQQILEQIIQTAHKTFPKPYYVITSQNNGHAIEIKTQTKYIPWTHIWIRIEPDLESSNGTHLILNISSINIKRKNRRKGLFTTLMKDLGCLDFISGLKIGGVCTDAMRSWCEKHKFQQMHTATYDYILSGPDMKRWAQDETGKIHTWYHVVYDLEHQFRTLEAAQAAFKPGTILTPRIPLTAMETEDKTIPRICVSDDIKNCLTAVRLYGAFKRCLAANEDAMSYAERLNEAYPILILTIRTNQTAVKPDKTQVPDVEWTNEHWLLDSAEITNMQTVWLNNYSIRFDQPDFPHFGICTSVRTIKDPSKNDHPWLNGKGHILTSSLMDYEPEEYDFIDYKK